MMIERLPRREREILEIVYALGEATAGTIREQMEDPLSDSAVRALLRRLEARNLVQRDTQHHRHLYSPVLPGKTARTSALRKVVQTFFSNSPVNAATALLGLAEEPDDAELAALERAIKKARERKK